MCHSSLLRCWLLVAALLLLVGGDTVEECMARSRDGSRSSFIGCIICRDMRHHRSLAEAVNGTAQPRSEMTTAAAAFDMIYEEEVWGKEGGGSGLGSDPNFAVAAPHVLRLVMYKYGLSSILDAPCGAVHNSWAKYMIASMYNDMRCFRYHGTDVVSHVVEQNAKELSTAMPFATFSTTDLSSPSATLRPGYDLILSRDALQHLSYAHIAGALATYCRSDARYLLVGSYLQSTAAENKDIQTGGCFAINLLVEPFNFPKPLESFQETPGPILTGVLPESSGTATNDNIAYIHSLFAPQAPAQPPAKYLLLYHTSAFCAAPTVADFIAKYQKF